MHITYPVLAVEVPLDGLADPSFNGLCQLPSELPLDFGCINGIATIVTGSALDEVNMLGATLANVALFEIIKDSP